MTAVVHIIGQLGYGGTERQLYLLLKHRGAAMPETQHVVVVLNPSEHGDYGSLLENIGVPVVDGGRSVARRLVVINETMRSTRATVVHSWSPSTNGYAALSARVSRASHSIASFRSSLQLGAFPTLPAPYRWLCIKGCQELIVNSRKIEQELRLSGVDDSRIHYIRNCVEIPTDGDLSELRKRERASLRTELGLSPEAVVIGMISNLRPEKNHPLAITALSHTLQRLPTTDAHLVIVGQTYSSEPNYTEKVQQAIAEHELESRVHLLGFREDARQIVAGYDFLCLSSDTEGMPNAIVEAMAHSLPVVATAVGGIPDLMDERHGFVVAPRDPDAMARAFEKLVANDWLRDRLGRAALSSARENHGTEINAAHFARLYWPRAAKAA